MTIDFSTVETTEDRIKVQRKASDFSKSPLLAPLTKSFEDGLAGKPNVLRIVVEADQVKDVEKEVRGVIEYLDANFPNANRSDAVPGVGKRLSKKEQDGGKVAVLFAAVPKSKRGPKGPRKPAEDAPAEDAAKGGKRK